MTSSNVVDSKNPLSSFFRTKYSANNFYQHSILFFKRNELDKTLETIQLCSSTLKFLILIERKVKEPHLSTIKLPKYPSQPAN